MHAIDHLLWAAPDLDGGKRAIAALTGVEATDGGVHPGGGTRNALLSLGERRYLEIIAPDPRQDARGTPAEWIGTLKSPGLATWAVRAKGLAALLPALARLSIQNTGVLAMSRKTTEGSVLSWEVLRLLRHGFGPAVPFFIDWLASTHPTERLAPHCRLEAFEIVHPRAEALRRLFEALELEAPIVAGKAVALSAKVTGPKGSVTLVPAVPLPAAWRDE